MLHGPFEAACTFNFKLHLKVCRSRGDPDYAVMHSCLAVWQNNKKAFHNNLLLSRAVYQINESFHMQSGYRGTYLMSVKVYIKKA